MVSAMEQVSSVATKVQFPNGEEGGLAVQSDEAVEEAVNESKGRPGSNSHIFTDQVI